MKKLLSNTHGFTLIEILIALTVLGILSSLSLASFVSFSREQKLNQNVQEVLSTIKQAKSYAQSQVKPDACNGETLEGYVVQVCGESCVSDPHRHKISVKCGGAMHDLTTRHISDDFDFEINRSVIFLILGNRVTDVNGATDPYYDIEIVQKPKETSGLSKTIRITNNGNISIL